ncbi:MAG TPA: methyltransferase domain-containing protein [Caldilineaceae bacterium]|nr:methyltransferase domain-containing protein [Caldilineaceae bacterium]
MDATRAVRGALDGALNVVTNSLATGLGAAVGSQLALRGAAWLQPRPMPHQMAGWLEHPARLRYRNPGELLGLFGLYSGMEVLDLGCGTGLFTVEMARMVGPTGTVHAVDLQAPLLAQTRRRLEAAGLAERVRFHHAGAYGLPLAENSVDVALAVAVLGEIPNRVSALSELRRVIKPGGRLAVSEELPDPAYVPAPLLRGWVERVGFRVGGKTGTPFCYSMVFLNEK